MYPPPQKPFWHIHSARPFWHIHVKSRSGISACKKAVLAYQCIKKTQDERILPLILDLCNPSPSLGWAHSERMSLLQRRNPDVVMALALIHHLAISNNLPLSRIAQFFSQLSLWLIIEFVPKDDSQVQRLLANRDDIFSRYNQLDFEANFSEYYDIYKKTPVLNSERTLYLMKRKNK